MTDSSPSIEFQLGAHSARITQIEKRQAMLEVSIDRRLEKLEVRIGAVHDVITSGRGGWKAISIMASITTVLSGAVAWALHLVWPR